MKKLLMTAAIMSFAFGHAALAADGDTSYKSETSISRDADGDAKSDTVTTSTDAAGTDRKDEKKVTYDAKSKGDFKKTVVTDSKTDPKGLFNTSKTETKDTVEKDDGKLTTEHKKTIDGDTVEDTKTEEK